ncbi:MAG: hypothetical protein ACI9C1_001033 [Candidatus Aldehydirespiratoraceae bacterium]|jgi:hypothetical protein
MTALAIVLITVGIGDLCHGLAGTAANRARAYRAAGGSVIVAIILALLLDVRGLDGALTVAAAIVISVSWQLVRVGFASPVIHLSTLGAGAVAAAMVSTIHLQDSGGVWDRYVDESRISLIHRHRPKEVLIVIALGIVMTATANAVVRLVLAVVIDGDPPTTRIRGGRVIGPLERLLILGLVIAGQPTTAALVVTAKSLLRYPELREHDGVDIHAVTEYVLIGSLMSWTIALAGAVLLA